MERGHTQLRNIHRIRGTHLVSVGRVLEGWSWGSEGVEEIDSSRLYSIVTGQNVTQSSGRNKTGPRQALDAFPHKTNSQHSRHDKGITAQYSVVQSGSKRPRDPIASLIGDWQDLHRPHKQWEDPHPTSEFLMTLELDHPGQWDCRPERDVDCFLCTS